MAFVQLKCEFIFFVNPKVCEIVLVSPLDFFSQGMHFETLEHSGDLMPRFADHNGAKEWF
jgi:hypothetical protein